MNFPIEESKENDFIIKAAIGNFKTRTIRNLFWSQAVQTVRINNQGAPLLGLAKSIYYDHLSSCDKSGFRERKKQSCNFPNEKLQLRVQLISEILGTDNDLLRC